MGSVRLLKKLFGKDVRIMELSSVQLRLTNSLHKQFPDEPLGGTVLSSISGMKGERISFQALIRLPEEAPRGRVMVEISSPGLQEFHLRRVISVPVRLAAFYDKSDDNYLRKSPGLYPDLLTEYRGEPFWLNEGESVSFWADTELVEEGEYPVVFRVRSADGAPGEAEILEAALTVTVVNAVLPEQKLMCTQWFHSDCLADYYHVPVFSEEYWEIVERFMRSAVSCGINMILTPTFTPALDTAVGRERTTVQLVEVTLRPDGSFQFGFERLYRWIQTAQRAGFRYFEMAHLFTQWGAKCCPKVMAHTPSGYRRIFGWDTAADSKEYMEFLSQYLPAITSQLKEWGIAEQCRFHLSDEPTGEQLEHYLKLKKAVEPYLKGFVIMDALSKYEFYEQGAVDQPVVALNHVQAYLDHHMSPLWVYYCVSQGVGVSNRFMAMPSSRNRVLGFQLYLENAEGFLQWGFNFYNSDLSERRLNPYLHTDGNGAWPAGDPFLVYPGEGGVPEGSIRQMVFGEAMQDHRACLLLERYIGREEVCRMIREAGILGFFQYPCDEDFIPALRERINRAIRTITEHPAGGEESY